MNPNKSPPTTNLPTELRLQIWAHYFSTLPITYKPHGTRTVPTTIKHAWCRPLTDYEHLVLELVDPSYTEATPIFSVETPALLKTCKKVRAEAMAFYLERLEEVEREEKRAYGELIEVVVGLRDWSVERFKDGKLGFHGRVTAIEEEIGKVRREVEKMMA